MATWTPVYRLTVYADEAMTTPLTPRAGAAHSDQFKVATHAGLAGFKPYLDFPRGRRSKINALKRSVDIGELIATITDQRMVAGGSNVSRWLTAYVGDEDGKQYLIGKLLRWEESLTGPTGTFSPYFTGRIHDVALAPDRVKMSLPARELAEDKDSECFTGRPHPTATYADATSLVPLGPPRNYGGFPPVPPIPATVKAWSQTGFGSGGFVLDVDRQLIKSGDLYVEVTRIHAPVLALFREFPVTQDGSTATGTTGVGRHPSMMVDLTVTSGVMNGQSGSFAVVPFQPSGFLGKILGQSYATSSDNDGSADLEVIGIAELPVGDPRRLAMPAAGSTVEFRVIHTGPPSEELPIYIDTVHTATLWRDILDGEFSRPRADYSLNPLRYDAAAFTARIADPIHGQGRWLVTKKWKRNEFAEQQLCLPFQYFYRYDALGQVVPIASYPPSSVGSLLTITNADLASGPSPGWHASLDGQIAEIVVSHYVDSQDKAYLISILPVARARSTWVVGTDFVVRQILNSPGLGRSDPFVIDAQGYRSTMLVADSLANILAPLFVQKRVMALIESYRNLFSGGLAETTLECRRTANTSGCFAGDLRIINVDEIPNAASNQRGGARVGRCVERTEQDDGTLMFRFVDLGANVIATTPSVSGLALVTGAEKMSVKFTVTVNAQAEPAAAWFIVTEPAEGVPAETDARWQFAQRVTATGEVRVDGVPANKRIRARARTEPEGPGLRLPSAWALAATPAFINTQTIAAPTGLSVVIVGTVATVTFTPAVPGLPIEMHLDDGGGMQGPLDTLPAGSTRAVYRGLTAATAHTFGLRHVDPLTGAPGIMATIPGSTAAQTQSPAMIGLGVLVGELG